MINWITDTTALAQNTCPIPKRSDSLKTRVDTLLLTVTQASLVLNIALIGGGTDTIQR